MSQGYLAGGGSALLGRAAHERERAERSTTENGTSPPGPAAVCRHSPSSQWKRSRRASWWTSRWAADRASRSAARRVPRSFSRKRLVEMIRVDGPLEKNWRWTGASGTGPLIAPCSCRGRPLLLHHGAPAQRWSGARRSGAASAAAPPAGLGPPPGCRGSSPAQLEEARRGSHALDAQDLSAPRWWTRVLFDRSARRGHRIPGPLPGKAVWGGQGEAVHLAARGQRQYI